MECHYFDAGRCRSCTLMSTPYAAQLADKVARAQAAVAPFAPALRWLEPATGPESAFRNKAKLVVAGRPGSPTFGILDGRGRGVDLRGCGLYEPGLASTFDPLHRLVADLGLEPYDVPGRRGELKHLIVTHSPDGEQMVRFVLRSRRRLETLRDAVPRLRADLPSVRVASVNLHPEHKAVLEGDTEVPLTDEARLPMRVGPLRLELGPRAFFQTNTVVAAALYRQAAEWVGEAAPDRVWDLYCGVGGFALSAAAPGRHVIGVETSADAVLAARAAATGIPGVEFVVGDATTATPSPPPGLVIVNPPRRGIGERLAGWLDACDARHLVYSSCNVDSLARDLAALPSWRPAQARVFDMFPQTSHQEVLVLLRRRSATPA